MVEYNEGWDEIVNHLLDDVGMKGLDHRIITSDCDKVFSAVDKDFAIFNNGFEVQYHTWFKYVYPADDYDSLLVVSDKTFEKFEKEVERFETLKKKVGQKEKVEDIAQKSSFIKDWYAKKWGKING